jgi:hypothetical protein
VAVAAAVLLLAGTLVYAQERGASGGEPEFFMPDTNTWCGGPRGSSGAGNFGGCGGFGGAYDEGTGSGYNGGFSCH